MIKTFLLVNYKLLLSFYRKRFLSLLMFIGINLIFLSLTLLIDDISTDMLICLVSFITILSITFSLSNRYKLKSIVQKKNLIIYPLSNFERTIYSLLSLLSSFEVFTAIYFSILISFLLNIPLISRFFVLFYLFLIIFNAIAWNKFLMEKLKNSRDIISLLLMIILVVVSFTINKIILFFDRVKIFDKVYNVMCISLVLLFSLLLGFYLLLQSSKLSK